MHDIHDTPALHRLLRRHGTHSLAYATLQPDMRYWGHENVGYAAYRKSLGQYTFLGDPICPKHALDAFLSELITAFPDSLFMQIQWSAAQRLKQLGHYVTPVGVENEIDTGTFSLAGKRKADLRHYRNKARASNIQVCEECDSVTTRAALRPVCDAWLHLKSWLAHELEFLARPFQGEPEPGTRIFTSRIDDTIVAFVVLDPIYDNNMVTGYTVSLLRHLPDAPEGALDIIILKAIQQCAAEGIPHVNLGVSPFHHIEFLARESGYGAMPVYWLYRALRRWGDPIYHFRGLSFHKGRYRAREIPVYTAVPGPVSLWSLYTSARACRML